MDSFRIKPLEWVSRSDGSHQEVGRRYEIEPDGKGWRLSCVATGGRNYLGYARDLDTAQAAAQSDHEARLSVDLEIDPAVTARRADVQRLTDALAAADGGWQPIETAPRDGTVIDLWDGSSRWTDMSWIDSSPRDPNGAWARDRSDWGNAFEWLTPTHWMPRPAAPALTGAAS